MSYNFEEVWEKINNKFEFADKLASGKNPNADLVREVGLNALRYLEAAIAYKHEPLKHDHLKEDVSALKNQNEFARKVAEQDLKKGKK